VLARVGRSAGAITNELYTLALNTAVATMALTPMLWGLTTPLYRRIAARQIAEPPQLINMPSEAMVEHIVVCGAGRVGRTVADALADLSLPCVLIELDDARVQQARNAGLPVIYGDAMQTIVLEAAGISRARAILVTIPGFEDVRAIVAILRRLNVDAPIVARAESPEAVRALYGFGIDEVTSPEFEAAIEMTRQALAHLHVPADQILQVTHVIRRQRYGRGPEPPTTT
jgi:CPA2 family monovalent cation:H+ antiporter-2